MEKRKILIIGIALAVFLLATSVAATSREDSQVQIYAFDQNPVGNDKGNEWVTLYNPLNESVDIGNWTLETADGEREPILKGTTLYPFAYYVYSPPYQWHYQSSCIIGLNLILLIFNNKSTFFFIISRSIFKTKSLYRL